MTRFWQGAAALGITVLAAGCASASGTTTAPAATTTAATKLSDATSESVAGGTWAAVPMGGSGPNRFWQLFSLTTANGTWSLRTPPDIATNGAIILAPQQGQGKEARTLAAGIRPSLDLTYSAINTTGDEGRAWSSVIPTSGLANVPDALAAAPDGSLLALGTDQKVSQLSPGGSEWTALTSEHSLATSAAGKDCGLTALTAVAYTAYGTPLLGGACGKTGAVGVFAYSAGTWQPAGPPLPTSLAGQPVQVLRLTRTGDTNTLLLEVGSGSSAVLAAAWTSDGGVHWTVSPALRLAGAKPVSVSFGSTDDGTSMAVVLTGGRGAVLGGMKNSWQPLPALPAGQTVTLALPATGATEALAEAGSVLTVSRLDTATGSWQKTQVINVPIEYGSSSA